VLKLSNEHLFTLAQASEIRWSSVQAYELSAENQRKLWLIERGQAENTGDHLLDYDQWLVDVSGTIDAINPAAPIYLLDAALDPLEHHGELDEALQGSSSRIVVWQDFIAFFGAGSCVVYFAGTSRYQSFLGGPWSDDAKGMLQLSYRAAETRALSTNERFGISRAKFQTRGSLYYVPNTRYQTTTKPSKGGHHASPVAHDRSAHRALLTRVSIDLDEKRDLEARQYTIATTEDLPAEVLERMTRRGKQATPGGLNAYRWIEKSASRVNTGGASAQRVTVIR